MAVAVIVGTGGIQKGLPQIRMVKSVGSHPDKVAEIGQQAAEGDAAEQQRLKLFDDAEIEQHEGNHDHDDVLPAARSGKESRETGLQSEFLQDTQYIHRGPPYAITTSGAPVSTTAPVETTI